MTALIDRIRAFARDDRASVPIEYGMLAVLIGIVCVGAMGAIGTNANTQFTSVQNAFK